MSYKLVILGDINVGKTALTIQTYDPTIVASYKKQTVTDDQPYVIDVLETAGQGEYTPLWDQLIREGEGFLLVYSISSRSTFEQVEKFKDQIIRVKGSNKIPLILIGNKCDKHTEREVSREEGINMAKRLGCEFFESSAKTFVNVESPFYTLVQMIRHSREKKTKRTINFKSPLKSLKLLLKINIGSISEEERKFKNQLKREHILFLDYNSFQNIKIIDSGSFGTISLEHHSNILRFYGITKEKYANNGNLCDYLKYNFNIMDWNIKLKFAKQIVSAVRHLHENKIVHRDLHSKNILIHNGNIKICDFGISKSLLGPSIEASKGLGTIKYSDPQYLINGENYSRNEKSDIYSIGVLLWEISSGHAPFAGKAITSKCIIVAIILGEREAIIKGTPRKYAEIYTGNNEEACWQGNPDLRPNIYQVTEDLNNINITDVVNLTDQTSNELQGDSLLNSTELSFSAQINSLENRLKDSNKVDVTNIIEGELQNDDLLYST
ncbi:4010_t:CDS:2 [Entrophospora sp. SA101]|nr:4010_t:CDS:2 [Entrophospora sp. SA101]